MDSSAAIRSSHCFMSHMQSSFQKPVVIPIKNVGWNFQSRTFIQSLAVSVKHNDSHNKWKKTLVSCSKPTEAVDTTKSEASLDNITKESLEKNPLQTATFPNGFEALLLDICDETQIAEVKLKVGEFEMHMKRSMGVADAPISDISQATPSPVPTKLIVESTTSTPPPKPSPGKTNPFVNEFHDKSPKLAALEASKTKNYLLVESPMVGLFRRGKTVKGNRQPPICKEGDIIKDGQVIGYLDQCGTSLPVKSNVAGEVLKILFQDEEAVAYGDPLIAVSPAFNNIN
ncbi:uncharacterized protein LOC127118107 isoform X1 [Lathyrus oleraceus]|uniref:Lipoyl-binding domain-containing protein n=1 Tax=Pisum sativum TaxID=3888 RepID=A0A9D5B8Q6_PEA|nr:uncharacterized protein LOC127118107 isoform X1 [Pisum sativum]KAI5434001.1 hypothetical protein KIW84_021018 [Pisum sativum]